MNNTRREIIDSIIEQLENSKARIEEVQSDEQDYCDNIPESMTAKIDVATAACDNLEYALDSLAEVIEYLQAARDGE